MFLTGKSGFGKTSALIDLLKDYNPLLVRNINSLKDLKDDNKAVILDDLDWSSIPRETKIHLLDKEYPSDIRVFYGVAKLGDDLIKVGISNNPKDLLNLWSKNDDAIERRICHVNVNAPMYYVQNNIFINFNLITENKKKCQYQLKV